MQVFNIPITHDLQDITHHGSLGFPVACYKTVVKDNVYGYVPLHWHDEVQLILVTEGCIKFTIDSQEYVLKSGDGIFINPEWLHSANNHDGDQGTFICVVFLPEIIEIKDSKIFKCYVEPIIRNPSIRGLHLRREVTWQLNILKQIEAVGLLFDEKKDFYELSIKCHICTIWKIILENIDYNLMVDNYVESEKNNRIKVILDDIHNNYNQQITLDSLSSLVNLSRSECSRTFKRYVGTTLFQYITRYRVSRSMELLKTSSKSITEIAHDVGFNGSSYFISTFKKMTKVTPSQYRNL